MMRKTVSADMGDTSSWLMGVDQGSRGAVVGVNVLSGPSGHHEPHGGEHQRVHPEQQRPPGSTPTQNGTMSTANGTYIAAAISAIGPQP